MLRTTVIGARALAVFLAAVVAIMAGAGGAMAATSTPVPASFTLPEDSRRFDGSVAVNVTIDVPRLRLVRPKQIMSLNDLSARFGVPDEAMAAMLGGDALVFPAGRSRTFHAESNGFSAASQQAADQAADRTSRSA